MQLLAKLQQEVVVFYSETDYSCYEVIIGMVAGGFSFLGRALNLLSVRYLVDDQERVRCAMYRI